MSFLFLQKDYDALTAKIDGIKRCIRDTYEVIHEATEQSSETYHDNYGYEEGMRQVAMLIEEMQRLSAVKAGAKVIEPELGNERVKIGSKVLVEDAETGEQISYIIGSYMCLCGDAGEISYTSPIAKLLLKAVAGEVRIGKIGSTERSFHVISIK